MKRALPSTHRHTLLRALACTFVVLALSVAIGPAGAMTLAERQALDLGAYRVTDPTAGLLDVAARRAALAETEDRLLVRAKIDLGKRKACSASRQMAPQPASESIPRFYEDRAAWRQAVEPYQAFEDAVSTLAAQQVVDAQSGAAECLLDLLVRWADAGALLGVDVKVSGLQTWFQVESSLIATSLAYADVRNDITGRDADKRAVETWLVTAARNHLSYEGGKGGTCCNNHFYRRALYATAIGVLAGDDALFRFGISAIYSAISDAAPSGALPLEMARGPLAAKYQVYAMMPLAVIAAFAARQGYDLYAVEIGGRRLGDVLGFTLGAMLEPETVAEAAAAPGQDASFGKDDQYFAWLELLAGDGRWSDTVQALLAPHRPAYSRSAGGYLSVLFLPIATSR